MLAVTQVVAILGQASFAALFLSGEYDMLGMHQHGADLVWYGGLIQLVVTLVLGWAGSIWWPAGVTAALVTCETGQYFAGLAGALYLHIPLGVVLAVGATLLAFWLCSPVAGRALEETA